MRHARHRPRTRSTAACHLQVECPLLFRIPARHRVRDRLRHKVRERNACHPAATGIVRRHGLTAVEKLRIRNLTRAARGTDEKPGSQGKAEAGPNREIAAQNWSLLRSQLEYKAAWAGREMVEVIPQYRSLESHRCSARNDPGGANTCRCGPGGSVAAREVNAAINIPAAGVLGAGASLKAVGPCVDPEPCARVAGFGTCAYEPQTELMASLALPWLSLHWFTVSAHGRCCQAPAHQSHRRHLVEPGRQERTRPGSAQAGRRQHPTVVPPVPSSSLPPVVMGPGPVVG